MKNYICNSNKYAYGKGYIYMPITVGTLPEKIEIDGSELTQKSTFHVSLLCLKDIIAKYKTDGLEKRIIEYFCEFTSKPENEISLLKFIGEFRLAKFEEKKALIVRCEVSNLDKFSKSLSDEFKIEVPIQPTHATLYTLQPDVGIGLNSEADMEAKSVSVEVSQELRSGLGLF